MTTPGDQPVTPDAPPPAPDAPPPDAPTTDQAPPDAPPPDAPPPDAPQVTVEDSGSGDGEPPLATETDRYIPASTSNETPIALPIQYEQYPTPPG